MIEARPARDHWIFTAGTSGTWRIDSIAPVIGDTLPQAECLDIARAADWRETGETSWVLRGATSHARYTHRAEADAMAAVQEGLARPTATQAALIPIRKTTAWWALAQDERRAIFEETSGHIRIGARTLPAVARRLHHCRDLGDGPFDFLTWFEYAPDHRELFEDMVTRLRATEEWRFVEREVDIRLTMRKARTAA